MATVSSMHLGKKKQKKLETIFEKDVKKINGQFLPKETKSLKYL